MLILPVVRQLLPLSLRRAFQFLKPFLKGVAEAALYWHIERAHSYRARSASKKGTWPLPPTFQDPPIGFGCHSSRPVPTHRSVVPDAQQSWLLLLAMVVDPMHDHSSDRLLA